MVKNTSDISSSDNTDFEITEDVNVLDNLPEYCNPLVTIFEERVKIENDFEREIWQLRKKYDKLFDHSADEIKRIVKNIDEKEEVGYWAESLFNCQDIAEFITEDDEPILNYITDLRSITITADEFSPEYPQFKDIGMIIEVEFKKNPFFKNTVLYKYFKLTFDVQLKDAINGRGAPYCYDSEGCTIDWYDDKDVTVEKVMKTQRHKKTQKVRTITKKLKKESFFNLFDTPQKTDGQFQAGILGQCPDLDYLLGEWISNVVIRRSFHFFLGPIGCEMAVSDCESFSDELDEEFIGGDSNEAEVANLTSHLRTFGMTGPGSNVGKNKTSGCRNNPGKRGNKRS